MAGEELAALFVKIGLSEQKAKETLKNATVSNYLKSCIDAVSLISVPYPVICYQTSLTNLLCFNDSIWFKALAIIYHYYYYLMQNLLN